VLKNVSLRKTVIFMTFSAEELGLYGSAAAAADFAAAGTNIEVMYNYDMVAYEPNPSYVLNLQSGANTAYLQLMAAAAGRVTAITTRTVAIQGNSDHYPFYTHGYNIGYGAEGDFNTPNYHSTHDSTTKLNFPYFTDVVKMAAAAVAYTGSAAHPTVIDSIVDQGDGHGLEIFWAACEPDYVYEVRYGTSPGVYEYTVPVTPGACSQLITGLTEGQRYYFSVRGQVPGGYPAAYFTESSEMSLVNPRVPSHPAAEPAVGGIILTWASNHEADLDHYNVYRKFDLTGDYMLLASGITPTTYTDQAVLHWVTYDYYVTAVDKTGHESAPSAVVQGTPATFDKGILVVNETTPEYDFIPTPSEATAYYDTVFANTAHSVALDTMYSQAVRRSLAGQFSSIFWFDDDIVAKLARYSVDSLRWFESFTTNTFMAGYTTIQYFSTGAVGPGHLLYDEFMLQSYALNYVKDFVGATGQNGWPSVQLDTTRGFKKMGDIPSLTLRPGAQVIYTYHSATSDPAREGKPVGIAYDGPHGRRILLAFPMYYLTPASATGLIAAAKTYFHESGQTTTNGDLDGSGFVDITDLGLMIDYLFFSQPIPAGLNSADIDASCSVDIADLSYFVDYIFNNGPAPQTGCVLK